MRNIKQFIHFIKRGIAIENRKSLSLVGERLNDLACLNLPILPSVVIEHNIADILNNEKIFSHIFKYIDSFEHAVGKTYSNAKNPMLLEITLSPNIPITTYPKIRNLGLTKNTIEGIQKAIGEENTKQALFYFLDSILFVYEKLLCFENSKKEQKELEERVRKIKEVEQYKVFENNPVVILEKYSKCMPKYFFEDERQQIKEIIILITKLSVLSGEEIFIIINPIIYGDNICFGKFFTRNIKTGDKKLEGSFFNNCYYLCKDKDKNLCSDISSIEEKNLTELKKIARKIEEKTCEICKIKFVIKEEEIYIIDAIPVKEKDSRAKIKLLLDLYNKKIIEAKDVVMSINMEDLNRLLHPSFDKMSIKDLISLQGGVSGAIGVTTGKVYFSSSALIQAKRIEPQEDCILCVNETCADDVQAIELSCGILSKTGGYASHAAVVARQYGKVSVVRDDMLIENKKAIIGDISIKEGEYISLHAPHLDLPTIYIGKAKLIFSQTDKQELLQLIEIASTFIKNFNVRANADSSEEAKLAIKLGAFGIGLCRTEHMFFAKERINVFREMIIAESKEERETVLSKLKDMQRLDFYEILKTTSPLPVTIRLLDSPLHEMLPRSQHEIDNFFNYISTRKKYTKEDLTSLIYSVKETNPMLGCRGCRMAILHPEIYKMQLEAIFEAMYSLSLEGINTNVEILIPLVMNVRELKQIRYGKCIEGKTYLAVEEIEEKVREKFKTEELNYKVGAMIELPSSALSAGDLARYSHFFSFGTNDLTQTTLGLSRDDFNSFASSYSMYDLLENNPFVILDENIKELMEQAILRARLTRADVVFGLCGEHAAEPCNIRIFMEMGGNYVSCNPYAVPIALFTIAQAEILRNKKE